MFFQGSLQEGIQAALQQSKFVVCFVTDGEDESEKWENGFLTDESIEPLLSARAVTLRLEAGSQAEGYLSQIYPLPKKPTLVIIKDAGLKEYIAAGTTREDFLGRLAKALLADVIRPQAQAQAGASSSEPASAAANSTQAAPASSTPASTSAPAPAPSPATTQSQSQNQRAIQSLPAERAARLDVQRKKEAEEVKRRRAEKGKGKATADEPGSSEPADSQSKHAEQLRKKQREAREERQRILKAIEDDKAARRAQKAERDAEKKRAAEGHAGGEDGGRGDEGGPLPFAPTSQLLPSTGRLPSESCSLQVRLFDGSTIRGRFTGRDTLRADVREWVDATRKDGGAPFTFKLVLTPLPNRTIDVTEEEKNLAELGLTPSATLILIPVPKSSSAYAAVAGTQGGNVVSRFFAYILALITGFYTLVVTFFSTMFSTAGPPPAPAAPTSTTRQGQEQQPRAQASGRDRGQVKGLRSNDKEKRNDQQFYNGNSTNFEPRRDEDEDEDED